MKIPIIEIILFTAILIGLLFLFNKIDTDYQNRIRNIDSIKTKQWRDKLGREHTKYDVILSEKADMLLSIQSKDSTINILKDLLKQYKASIKRGGSITTFNTIARIDTIVKTRIDTFNHTINSNIDLNKWGYIDIATTNDSSQVSINIKNRYDIVIGYQSINIFKKIPYAEIISNNPYVHIENARTYSVKGIKTPRLTLGIQAGYGMTYPIKLAPYIGIGLQYNLLTLWQ